MKAIREAAGVPFIVKGIMTVKGALKAKEAGAAAIVVSNHGGRVLDQCPATAEVLEEIAEAVGGSKMCIRDRWAFFWFFIRFLKNRNRFRSIKLQTGVSR